MQDGHLIPGAEASGLNGKALAWCSRTACRSVVGSSGNSRNPPLRRRSSCPIASEPFPEQGDPGRRRMGLDARPPGNLGVDGEGTVEVTGQQSPREGEVEVGSKKRAARRPGAGGGRRDSDGHDPATCGRLGVGWHGSPGRCSGRHTLAVPANVLDGHAVRHYQP